MPSSNPGGYEEKSLFRLIHDVYVYLDHGDRLILDKFSLTPTQFRLLCLLDSKKGQRLTTLSDRLLRSKSQITRVVDLLENNNIVQRTMDPLDRRAQLVVLTKAGITLRDGISKEHQDSLEKRFDILDENEKQVLTQMLNKLKQGMAKYLEIKQLGMEKEAK
jgi:DNA-binding MarR family transcriptional regulator